MTEKNKLCAIYKIVNLVNNKCYIGSTKDLKKRIRSHLGDLKRNKHHCIALQRAYNKYGKDNFIILPIWVCQEEDRLQWEQIFMDEQKPEYNMAKSSSAPMEGRKHSPETIEKFKNRPVKKGKDHHKFGSKWTDEHRSAILTARREKNYKHSSETRKKMSETSKKLNRAADLKESIERQKRAVVDNLGNKFNSMVDAANFHGVSVQTVCDILKGRHSKTRKKVSFNYV
jgi:group I intron endonuclease